MRTRRSAALLLLPFLTVALLVAQSASGLVTRVIDGDTIVVSGVGTVRLIGVDTPEMADPRKPVEYFGHEASAFTRRLAEGKTVRLEFEGTRTDRHNRTLAYVYLPDGRLLNADIIRQGYGHAYTQFPFSKLEEFRQLQQEAMAQNRGLWAPTVERASMASASQGAAPSKAAAAPRDSNAGETVYATRTGTKYHRAGCRHLARSQIPLPLKEAAARYGPCSVCSPPTLSGNTATPSSDAVPATAAPRSTPAPTRPAATSGRCQATTKKGTQCSRSAQPGRSYCWQH